MEELQTFTYKCTEPGAICYYYIIIVAQAIATINIHAQFLARYNREMGRKFLE